MAELRVFIAETDGAWTELTEGDRPVMRLSALAVVLDLAVSVADDVRPRAYAALIRIQDRLRIRAA